MKARPGAERERQRSRQCRRTKTEGLSYDPYTAVAM